MKIGIDARMYGSKQAGLGRYIAELIKHLEKIDQKNHYVIFLHPDNYDQYTPNNKHFKKIKINIRWYSLKEQLCLNKIIKKQKLDLMHFPHWNVPLLYKKPFIVTIHDLIMYHYPRKEASTHGPLVYFIKDKLHRLVVKQAAKKAKKIIVPSNFTKQDIIKTLNIESNKIETIYLSNYQKNNNQKFTELEIKKTLKKYNIIKPYLLYIGSAYPHKNLHNLVLSWQEFYQQYGDDYQIILAGKTSFFYNQLKQKTKELKIQNLIYTGYLNEQEIEILYSQARLYVIPSLYEGFGLPPLEAMQYNIPVISSQASCLPEILNDAAIYFNPKNKKEIIRAIHLGLHDQDLRKKLTERSKQLLTKYSWQKTAMQTKKIYQSI